MESKKTVFVTTCSCCGKKFECEDFFIDTCPDCMSEYISWTYAAESKSTNNKSNEEVYDFK